MAPEKVKIFSAGGQAVIEGVMMRSEYRLAIAVRRPNKKISVKKETIKSISDKITFFRWPFVRGIFNLFQMLYIGMKALIYSANESMDKVEEELTFLEIVFSIVFAIGFAIILFKFVPLLIAQYFYNTFAFVHNSSIVFNLIDGFTKMFLFVVYILVISLMRDVRTIFEYHGAEHKAVNCYEAEDELTVKNVKKYPRLHPRCGTNFILLVFLLSIIVYTLIPKEFSFWAKFGLRLLLLPVIAGISYELLKLCGKYRHNFFLKLVALPGLAAQLITTREPDNRQIEVGIAALKGVISKESVVGKDK
ncbi:MAG: DUF1385 domain-containing protein [Candidatus Woesearchaeota archaeon]|nr:DUF1385 domain-containing protein [Candidatus Woesearchaeota archaeon]